MRRTTATPEYLKESMGSSLLELMKEKPLEKITIEEMTAKADVGRSTYFRYFKTKEEVLAFKLTALYSNSFTHNIRPVDTVSELTDIVIENDGNETPEEIVARLENKFII